MDDDEVVELQGGIDQLGDEEREHPGGNQVYGETVALITKHHPVDF